MCSTVRFGFNLKLQGACCFSYCSVLPEDTKQY